MGLCILVIALGLVWYVRGRKVQIQGANLSRNPNNNHVVLSLGELITTTSMSGTQLFEFLNFGQASYTEIQKVKHAHIDGNIDTIDAYVFRDKMEQIRFWGMLLLPKNTNEEQLATIKHLIIDIGQNWKQLKPACKAAKVLAANRKQLT